ncbi:hypothetical protein B0J13DRAFT_614807 [Dactylonectria estremocensis]|uniref:Uncharacterized protein n=1 Tax=Dactylonectria estremocensis TaxID=1079267 RepID=A0A9P9JHY6_9HYPO|nr:hypothetical protein B0J13DRAFT_614807 [Dactylonectria estremocensis]
MSTGPNSFDRLLSFLTTLLLTGVVVILAMLLVEFKRLSKDGAGIVVRIDDAPQIEVYATIASSPVYVSALPSGIGRVF